MKKENIAAIYTVAAYDWLIGIAVLSLVFSVTNSMKSITTYILIDLNILKIRRFRKGMIVWFHTD